MSEGPKPHAGSPVLVDDTPQARLIIYRERVLQALRDWDMRPSDTRHPVEVVAEVEIP
jgi:hypothetical protein